MLRYLVVLTLLVPPFAAAQELETYVFRGVNVVPMDTERVLGEQSVVVAGGRIAAIGAAAETPVPSGATVIDAGGRFLMPGLTEMHAHVPGNQDAQYLEDVLFLFVANGVTTVRGMLGQPSHLELRERIARHEILGPRLITSGPSLRGGRIESPEHARRIVLEQAALGYDFVKIHPGLTRAQYDAGAQAAAETGLRLAGHVPEEVGIAHALEKRQATIDHLDGYVQYLIPPQVDISGRDPGYYGVNLLDLVDADRIARSAAETRAAGAWVVPTQILVEQRVSPIPARELAARAETAYMPPDMVERWVQTKERLSASVDAGAAEAMIDIRRRLIRAFHDEGVLLLGSDAPQVFNVPGFSAHHELRAIMAAGLSSYEALRSGTVAPADFFGARGEFGSVRAGLAADLILLDGNPLEDATVASRPLGVMVRGLWLDRARLDDGLAAIAARQR